MVNELAQQRPAGLQLIRDGLALQKRYSLRVPVPQQLFQLPDVAVFAAQTQHQHASGVGMADQIAEDLAGMLLIVSGLGAAIGMGPGVNTGDAAPDRMDGYAGQRLGYTVDAAHGGDDPDLIADAHAALAPEPPEGPGGGRGFLYRSDGGGGDGLLIEGGGQIMAVDPVPHVDGLGGVPDGKAVLHHGGPGGDIRQRQLVALRNVLPQSHGSGGGLHDLSSLQGLQRHGHVVVGMNLQDAAHSAASFRQASMAAAMPSRRMRCRSSAAAAVKPGSRFRSCPQKFSRAASAVTSASAVSPA